MKLGGLVHFHQIAKMLVRVRFDVGDGEINGFRICGQHLITHCVLVQARVLTGHLKLKLRSNRSLLHLLHQSRKQSFIVLSKRFNPLICGDRSIA